MMMTVPKPLNKEPVLMPSLSLPSLPNELWKKVALAAAAIFGVLTLVSWAAGCPLLSIGCATLSLVSIASVVFLPTILKKYRAEHLTPELLPVLVNNKHSLGLRCVWGYAQENREAQTKIFGDSLNLDPSNKTVWEKIFPKDTSDKKIVTDRIKLIENPEEVSLQIKKTVASFWEKGVIDFICMQIKVFKNNENPTFFIIGYGKATASAYDLDKYGKGLGKKGAQYINPTQIKYTLYPPEASLTDEELVEHYYSSIIRWIKQEHENAQR